MPRKNKPARRAAAAAASAPATTPAPAPAITDAAPDESQAQASPAQAPAPTPLRLPPLVPEAAPPPPPHPNSAAASSISSVISGNVASVPTLEFFSGLSPNSAASSNYPPFQLTLLQTWQQVTGSQELPQGVISPDVRADVFRKVAEAAWTRQAGAELDEPTDTLTTMLLVLAAPRGSSYNREEVISWFMDGYAGWATEHEVNRLTEQGEDSKAHHKLCMLGYLTLLQWGPEHPFTLRAVYRVTESLFQRGDMVSHFYTWLLPRAVEQWGIGHADTLRLVQLAAMYLGLCEDARKHTAFTQLVTELAQQLPGGLGWGSAVVAPVPDQEGFCRHVFMAAKACDAKCAGHYKLARDMLKRCVTFFDGLGPHWLASPRKVACMQALADCAATLEGLEARKDMLLQAKRTSIRELGSNHTSTLDITWSYGESLVACHRSAQALSLLQTTLQLRRDVLGPRHIQVLKHMICLAKVLRDLGKRDEGEAMLKHALDEAIKVEGGGGIVVAEAMCVYGLILDNDPDRKEELAALRRRAAEMGCDISIIDSVKNMSQSEEGARLLKTLLEWKMPGNWV